MWRQGASLRGRLPPATLAKTRKIIGHNKVKEPDRGPALGANWRLANAQRPILQENNPDAACMHDTNMYKFVVLYILRLETKKGRSFAHHSALWLYEVFILAGEVSISSLVLGTQRTAYRCSTTCWLSPALSPWLRWRTLIGTYVLRCFVQPCSRTTC